MTVDFVSSWFDPLPLADYVAVNKAAGETVPDEAPVAEPVGGLDVRCGPILRFAGSLENGEPNYRGSVMLIVKGPETPEISYKIGPAAEGHGVLDLKEGVFPPTRFHEEKGFVFWRFTIDLTLASHEQKVKYLVNNVYRPLQQFFVPSRDESFNVVSFSCNGFSLGTDTSTYKLLLWLDVLKKHQRQHYHVMLGGGDQIYSDAVKLHSKVLQEWMDEGNPLKKRATKATPALLAELEEFYLENYLGWFGLGHWVGKNSKTLQAIFPLTMAQIPSVNIYDDHDIIDGFGLYRDHTMKQEVFTAIGRIAYKYYMLFQHQMLLEEKLYTSDPSWILSTRPGPFINQQNHSVYTRLGKEVSLLGLDCRTERKLKEIISPNTYKKVFTRLEAEITKAPETKHLLVMLGVPILYPRLVWLEWLLTLPFLVPFRKLAERGVLSKGLVNEFDGEVEVLDDLNDHWCSKNHKRERNYLIKNLIEFGALHGVRVTILSGDVHLGCFGRIKSKYHHHLHSHLIDQAGKKEKNELVLDSPKHDPRLIFNVISSAIINAPPPDGMATMLNKRSKIHHFDRYTDEDVIPLFRTNPDGSKRENHQFLNKRNWSDLVLAKQSYIYKDRISEKLERFPGPVNDTDEDKLGEELHNWGAQQPDARHVKYPLLENTLVTGLHVENDGNDYEATTKNYEVFIPHLEGKHKLEKTAIKHLGEAVVGPDVTTVAEKDEAEINGDPEQNGHVANGHVEPAKEVVNSHVDSQKGQTVA